MVLLFASGVTLVKLESLGWVSQEPGSEVEIGMQDVNWGGPGGPHLREMRAGELGRGNRGSGTVMKLLQ